MAINYKILASPLSQTPTNNLFLLLLRLRLLEALQVRHNLWPAKMVAKMLKGDETLPLNMNKDKKGNR